MPGIESISMGVGAAGANSRNRLQLFFEAASLALALGFIGLFLITSLQRFRYPFELEWMEGLMVEHVHRLLTGLPIYTQPGYEFTALRYAPLYYYLCAPFAAISGNTLVSMRVVSILSTVGCAGVIFAFIRRDISQNLAAALGAGMFMSGYALSDSWFDLARPDMLFILLLLLALYIMRFHTSLRGLAIAAVVSFLAAMAKQTAIPIALILFLSCFTYSWRRGAIAIGTFSLLLIISTIIGNVLTDGWYQFYVIDLGKSNQIIGNVVVRGWSFITDELLRPYGIASLFAIFYLLYLFFKKRNPRTFVLMTTAAIVMIGTSLIVRISAGSWNNTVIPAWTVISLLFGLGYGRAREIAATMSSGNRRVITSLIGLLCIFQFITLIYLPGKFIPSELDRRAGDALVAKIASFDEPVWVPFHNILTVKAGKKSYAHRMALHDVLVRGHGKIKESLEREIRDIIKSGYFQAILIDREFFASALQKSYIDAGRAFDDKSAFYPVAGWKIRPESIYVRVSDSNDSSVPAPGTDGK